MEEIYQVSLMPWGEISSHQKCKIGPVTIKPFKNSWLPVRHVRNYLNRYAKCFVDYTGSPVDTITLCLYEGAGLRRLNDEELAAVRRAVDALLFATIGPGTKVSVRMNNRSVGPPSSERFELVTRDFDPADEFISVRAGALTVAGYTMREIRFPKPYSMGGGFGIPDAPLIKSFDRLESMSTVVDVAAKARLFRSLEWFRLAHSDTHQVSLLSKVVMMGTAFETLLNLPDYGPKKKPMANYLQTHCCFTDSIQETRNISKPNGTINTVTYPKMSWWMWDFYDLRNSIAHGEEITPDQFAYAAPDRDWLTHLIVAELVFYELVVRQLFDWGLYQTKVNRLVVREPRLGSPLIAMFLGLADYHRDLGWRTKVGLAGDDEV